MDNNYVDLTPFRFWCQKVLPLVYDDELSYYELLCKVVDYLNKTMQDVSILHDGFTTLKNFVDNYFDNLDVQNEINNKLDEMVISGELQKIIDASLRGVAIYLGNSYTEGVGSSTRHNGIYNRTKNMFSKTYVQTVGGAGFCEYNAHPTTFDIMLQNQANTMTSEEKNSVTHIMCISAIGDTRYLHENPNIDNFIAKVKRTYTVMANNFPNAKMHIFFCGCVGRENNVEALTNYNNDVYTHYCFEYAVKQIPNCIYYGWMGWDNEHRIGLFSDDGYHPNDQGYEFIVSNMLNAMKGTFSYQPKMVKYVTENGGITCYITNRNPYSLEIVLGIATSDLRVISGTNVFIDLSDKICCGVDQDSYCTIIGNNKQYIDTAILRLRKGKISLETLNPVTLTDKRYFFTTPVLFNMLPQDKYVKTF